MKKIFLIINILNFYIYQFVDKHKKILPTYPTDVTSEKILGFLLTILCLTIFLIVDKLYPLKVEYVFAFIIPLCLLHYYALIYKKRWVHYMNFIKKTTSRNFKKMEILCCIIFTFTVFTFNNIMHY